MMELTNFGGNTIRNGNEAPFEVHVLVVDGDAASLEITLGLLASLKYKAEGTKHPLIALERVRKKEGYFDLVVIEPLLPDIDVFQFKHKLDQHFSIPLIMISIDKDERMMEKALKSGVARYIVKPATESDFKEGGGDNNNGSSSSSSSRVTKKSKVVWTSDLQNRFLQAINIIGLENAVPKKILEVMKTPGLTRENVASHLQKYRLFLKRVARMFAMVINNEIDNKDVLTSLASKYPDSLMLKNIEEEFRRMLQSRKLRTSSSYPYYSSYKNPDNSSSLFKPPKFQYHPHNSSNFSTQMMMNPNYGLLHGQVPASTSSNYTTNNAGLLGLGFPRTSSSTTYYEYCGYNNSFNNGSNYCYLGDERVSPAGNNELFRENQSLPDMKRNNNNNNNILENMLEQQGKPNEVLNNEGDHCHQTIGVEGNNGFDSGNIIMQEDHNYRFSNQVLEMLNLSEKDLEDLKDPEQIPQDWTDDFLESLLNNGG
ncbi:two-component response regulator ARR18-like [Neltuma alba]|uniref:two-component response regulator ARR18-like n=1 Tax=Neltuma alba TaxID=207710 RepID=UPI0010A2D1C6|nr:two-component response regulator ARR18-like [Prosopis alba]